MNESQAKQLRELVLQIAAYHPDSLCQGDKQFNFEEYRWLFRQVYRFFQLLGEANLELIPVIDFSGHIQGFTQLKNTLEQIVNFNPLGGGDPKQRRNELFIAVAREMRDAYAPIAPHLAYALLSGGRHQEIDSERQKQLDETVTEVLVAYNNLKNSVNQELVKMQTYSKQVLDEMQVNSAAANSVLSQLQETAESAKRAARITAVSAQSQHFDDLAKENLDSASASALSAIIIGAFLLIFGYALFANPEGTTGSSQLIQKIVGRLIFISVGFTAFVVCLRNYSAAKHNYTVNKHKATTLRTFEVFISGAASDEIKQAILLQAAKSAFEPQSSGFLRSEGDGPQINQVTDIIRAVGPMKGPQAPS